jgi:hypothetical protein
VRRGKRGHHGGGAGGLGGPRPRKRRQLIGQTSQGDRGGGPSSLACLMWQWGEHYRLPPGGVKHSVPVAEVKRILGLYRERYRVRNVRHFWQTARREEGVKVSYTFVKEALQGAGLVAKRKARGRQRRRRERRGCFGEMLHLDGSRHAWLSLLPEEEQTLITVRRCHVAPAVRPPVAGGEHLRGAGGSSRRCQPAWHSGQSLHGSSWAFETPRAGRGGGVSRTHLTQVGEVLKRLGVEHIPSYSPQARGRCERMNGTLQARLVNVALKRPTPTSGTPACPPTTNPSRSSPGKRRVPSWRPRAWTWTRSSAARR